MCCTLNIYLSRFFNKTVMLPAYAPPDVDECRYQLDNCSDDKRICANTIGGFVCNCPNGTMLNNISQCEGQCV